MFSVLEAEWMACSVADLLIFAFYLLTLGKVIDFLGTDSTPNASTSALTKRDTRNWVAPLLFSLPHKNRITTRLLNHTKLKLIKTLIKVTFPEQTLSTE